MTALHRLVEDIDRARPWPSPPVWIRICGPVAGPHSIEEDVGFDRLVGFVAPRLCSAIGVVAGGWATPLTGRPDTDRQRVRTTLLMDRDGRAAARVRWASGRTVDESATSGRMLDCLRRALSLATDAPPVGTEALFASMWLAALASERQGSGGCGGRDGSGGCGGSGPRIGWPAAAALHPVGEILRDEVPVGSGWLVEAARALAIACPWSEIRRLIAAGSWEESGIAPDAAAWMDDGMLCRWLLEGRVPLGRQLAAAVERLSPLAARRVRGTLRELGLASE